MRFPTGPRLVYPSLLRTQILIPRGEGGRTRSARTMWAARGRLHDRGDAAVPDESRGSPLASVRGGRTVLADPYPTSRRRPSWAGSAPAEPPSAASGRRDSRAGVPLEPCDASGREGPMFQHLPQTDRRPEGDPRGKPDGPPEDRDVSQRFAGDRGPDGGKSPGQW